MNKGNKAIRHESNKRYRGIAFKLLKIFAIPQYIYTSIRPFFRFSIPPYLNTSIPRRKRSLLLGFSLVELMISLITISAITAAFAPVITKKLQTNEIIAGVSNSGGISFNCAKEDCVICDKSGNKCYVCNKSCADNEYLDIANCECKNCSTISDGCGTCEYDKATGGGICTGSGCEAGKYLNSSGNCVDCPALSYSPEGYSNCITCPSGCTACDKKTGHCTACIAGYGLSINASCVPQCSCATSHPEYKYNACSDGGHGYIWVCDSCNNSSLCSLKSVDGRLIVKDGNGNLSCGTINNTNFSCTPKPNSECSGWHPQCISCDALGCRRCTVGYYAQNGTCYQSSNCDSACNACYPDGCRECYSGYYLKGGNCHYCGLFHPQCNACTEAGCTDCGDVSSGSTCRTVNVTCGEGTTQSGSTCVPASSACDKGTYLKDGKCVRKCPPEGYEYASTLYMDNFEGCGPTCVVKVDDYKSHTARQCLSICQSKGWKIAANHAAWQSWGSYLVWQNQYAMTKFESGTEPPMRHQFNTNQEILNSWDDARDTICLCMFCAE